MMNFMGKEGFVWWVGVVEDRNDPLYLGRCKVRILGWHTKDKSLMPTSQLPWCYPVQPITSAAQTQVGSSPTGVVEGTWVIGFYKDGEDAQEPMMFGSLGGIPQNAGNPFEGFSDPRDFPVFDPIDVEEGGGVKLRELDRSNWPRDPDYANSSYRKNGSGLLLVNRTDTSTFPDTRYLSEPTTNRLARGLREKTAKTVDDINGEFISDTIVSLKKSISDKQIPRSKGGKNQDESFFNEPQTPYSAIYPYNHVHQSESGHVIEIDDTPRAERLHWFHRSGTFREMHPDGTMVDKTVLDFYQSVMRNSYEHIYNTKITTVDRGYELLVNNKEGLEEDFAIRVGKGGNYSLNMVSGNISMSAPNRTVDIQSGSLNLTSTDNATINVRNQLTLNVGTIAYTTQSNLTQSTDGTYSISGAQIVLGSENNIASTGQSENHNIAAYISENIQTPISDPTLLPANGYSRSIVAGIGKMKMECLDGALSGGIEFNMGQSGVTSQIIMAPAGGIDIKNVAGSSIDISSEGQISSSTAFGSSVVLTSSGNLETTTTTGDIVTTSQTGNIETASQSGKVTVKSGTADVEIMSESSKVNIEALSEIVIEAIGIKLGKGASKETAIMGTSFMENFLKHQHATGTGPSGPVLNGSPYVNTLSKKVFLE